MNCSKCGKELPSIYHVCGCCCESYTVHTTYICPKCGRHCDMFGFCPGCGWWASPPPPVNWPPRTPWRCPGCGRYHAPHVDTCPHCQPIRTYPWPVAPYIGDPLPYIYITTPTPWTTTTIDTPAVTIYNDPPNTSGGTVSAPTEGVFHSTN